jgi:hypothetical protein
MALILARKLDAPPPAMVDVQAIIAGVLAGLPTEAIAAAIPTDLAERVVDLLVACLAS